MVSGLFNSVFCAFSWLFTARYASLKSLHEHSFVADLWWRSVPFTPPCSALWPFSKWYETWIGILMQKYLLYQKTKSLRRDSFTNINLCYSKWKKGEKKIKRKKEKDKPFISFRSSEHTMLQVSNYSCKCDMDLV